MKPLASLAADRVGRARFALLLGLILAGCSSPDAFAEGEAAYARADYAAARAAYEQALRQPGAAATPARARAQLGLTLRKLGELAAAEAVLQRAIDEARGEGDAPLEAVARRYLGQVYAAEGERPAAMAQFDAALAFHREHGPTADLLKVQTSRAALAWEMDDFQAAYDAYADVYDRAQAAGDTALEAQALDGLGVLMAHVGEHESARWLVTRAGTLHAGAERTEALARSTLNLANLAAEEGRFAEARDRAAQASEVAARSGNRLLQAQARLVLANACLAEGLHERAIAAADEGLALGGSFDAIIDDAHLIRAMALAALERWPDVDEALGRLEARGRLPDRWKAFAEDVAARRAAAAGDAEGELTHRRRAIDHFECLRGQFGPEMLASFYNRRRLGIYQDLLRALVRRDRVDEAADLVGRIKARALVEDLLRLHRGDVAAAGPDPRRLQRGANLRQVASGLGAPPGVVALASRLPDDTAVLDYYALPDELLVFHVTRSERRLLRVAIDAASLAGQAAALERGILGRGRDYEAPAAWLAARLLDPLAAALNGPGAPRRLCVVPHGPLHRVPFEVLPWGGERLLDRFDVFSAPSLPALAALLEAAPATATPRVLAVGDPVENLPGARAEAARIAALFPERTVLLGAQAVETTVRAAMGAADVVHLAVHGIEPTSGRPAWLELLPDSAHDGRLFADEIAALRLKSSLVTLSACDSGVGAPNRGDEIPGVLDRAFLQAGARTVISSRWPVSDAATLRFMDAFYGALAEQRRLGAFAAAQRALRSGRVTAAGIDEGALATAVRGVRRAAGEGRPTDFTHPYFWASFALKGDPR